LVNILHIIKDSSDSYPFSIIEIQKKDHNVTVLLIHDAVYISEDKGVKTVACKADVLARGIHSPWELLDYEDMVELIFQCDRVICW